LEDRAIYRKSKEKPCFNQFFLFFFAFVQKTGDGAKSIWGLLCDQRLEKDAIS
jgi:hypothetical protein